MNILGGDVADLSLEISPFSPHGLPVSHGVVIVAVVGPRNSNGTAQILLKGIIVATVPRTSPETISASDNGLCLFGTHRPTPYSHLRPLGKVNCINIKHG